MTIYWVDKDIIEMNTLGGKGLFCFGNNFFVITDIVLIGERKQILNLKPLDTSHSYAHEVNFDFLVLEYFEVKKNEEQALVHC